MSEYFTQVFCEENYRYSVVIEDDGRVAYAYLLEDEDIIADVWLYNQSATPKIIDWNEQSEMPFLNPLAFIIDEGAIEPLSTDEDIEFKWIFLEDAILLKKVIISFGDKLTVALAPDSKPGWSNNVKNNGPLAKVFTHDSYS